MASHLRTLSQELLRMLITEPNVAENHIYLENRSAGDKDLCTQHIEYIGLWDMQL